MRELLFIAVVLACPLMMILMMRGGHGGHDHDAKPRGAAASWSFRQWRSSPSPPSSPFEPARRPTADRLVEPYPVRVYMKESR